MADENKISVTNGDNSVFQLEITPQNNKLDLQFDNSINTVMIEHNVDFNAHTELINALKQEYTSEISALSGDVTAINQDISSAQDDLTELSSQIEAKLDVSDSTVTRQGNTFNGAGQLLKLDSSGKLPALDGRNLTGLSNSFANLSLSNINLSSALTYLGFLGNNFSENGYYKFPNGLVIQWGNVITTASTTGQTITFPIAFANTCLSVIPVVQSPSSGATAGYYHYISGKYNTYFTTGYTASKYWIAIGY